MLDFLGQELVEGDWVVMETPWTSGIAIGKIVSIGEKQATVAYIHSSVWTSDSRTPKEKEERFDSLKKIKKRQDIDTDCPCSISYRYPSSIVKISQDQLSNFLEAKL